VAAQSLLLLGDAGVEPVRAVLAELIGYPEVRDRLAGMISGLDVRYGCDPHPLVGARLPHLVLGSGPESGSTTALLRSGRGLLLELSADPARQARLRALVGRCARRVDLVPSSPGTGPVSGLDAVLLRPDDHVAWVGSGAADPRPGLRRWFG
jgi:aromatic ring hydroxylase-like protein